MPEPLDITDGRRQRSEDSKQRIVDAMLALVSEGKIAPTAEEVAQRANVGLRTVFRRFKDMESLYAEMSNAITASIQPLVKEPPGSSDWSINLAQLLERRLKVYEVIRPYRVAADVLKFQSSALLSHHLDVVRTEREILLKILPDSLHEDRALIEGLEAVLSFDMWSQLRHDQKLPSQEAADVIYRIVSRLLPDAQLPKEFPAAFQS